MRRLLILLLTGIALTSAQAQFASNNTSVVLDNTGYEFFSNGLSETTADFTTGGSSMRAVLGPSTNGLPQLSGFVDGPVTLTFDWRLDQGSAINNAQFSAYSATQGLVATRSLSATTNDWCRETVYLPAGVDNLSWVLDNDTPPGAMWIDNVQVSLGNRPAARVCGITRNTAATASAAPSNSTAFMPSVMSLLLGSREIPSINGEVRLPSGQVAPAGGITMEVSTFPFAFFSQDGFFVTTVDEITIAEGESVAEYTILLPPDGLASESYKLQFDCEFGCENLDVTNRGSWSDSRGVTSLFNADGYPANRENEADIQLEVADSFVGTINFFDGYQTTGNEFIIVTVRDAAFLSFDFFSQSFFPNAGESQLDFDLRVPSGVTAGDWRVVVSCTDCSGLSNQSQFATSVSGNPVSASEAAAFLFSKSADYLGMVLTIPAP